MKNLLGKCRENINFEALLRDNKEMILKAAAVVLAIVAAFFVFASEENSQDDSENAAVEAERIAEEQSNAIIYVDIGGEVKNPMLAELPEGSRVDDAIKAAGGLTDKADITEINRAAFVEDGEKIYIPARIDEDELAFNEGGEGVTSDSGSLVYSDGKININTADAEELQTLTGVGPVTAQKIIDYRKENGRFSSTEDIKNVSGIGDKTFEKLKDDIRV